MEKDLEKIKIAIKLIHISIKLLDKRLDEHSAILEDNLKLHKLALEHYNKLNKRIKTLEALRK